MIGKLKVHANEQADAIELAVGLDSLGIKDAYWELDRVVSWIISRKHSPVFFLMGDSGHGKYLLSAINDSGYPLRMGAREFLENVLEYNSH